MQISRHTLVLSSLMLATTVGLGCGGGESAGGGEKSAEDDGTGSATGSAGVGEPNPDVSTAPAPEPSRVEQTLTCDSGEVTIGVDAWLEIETPGVLPPPQTFAFTVAVDQTVDEYGPEIQVPILSEQGEIVWDGEWDSSYSGNLIGLWLGGWSKTFHPQPSDPIELTASVTSAASLRVTVLPESPGDSDAPPCSPDKFFAWNGETAPPAEVLGTPALPAEFVGKLRWGGPLGTPAPDEPYAGTHLFFKPAPEGSETPLQALHLVAIASEPLEMFLSCGDEATLHEEYFAGSVEEPLDVVLGLDTVVNDCTLFLWMLFDDWSPGDELPAPRDALYRITLTPP